MRSHSALAVLALALLSPASPAVAGPPAQGAPAWACPMGPVVGKARIDAKVPAGVYQAAFAYSRSVFLTTERSFTDEYRGQGTITLAEDGALSACLGTETSRAGSVGRYESPDGKDHSSGSQDRALLGMTGRWRSTGDGAHLTIDRVAWGRCDTPADASSPVSDWQLACGLLAQAGPLPGAALACRAVGDGPSFDDVALDLGANRRAGAWPLRDPVLGHGKPDPRPACGPWLLAGADPGLTVTAEGRDDEVPTITFSAGAPTFNPKRYLRP